VTLLRCEWCGRRFSASGGAGRPRLFCKRSCRQRSYEARLRAAEVGLGEHELVVARQELETTQDRLWVLAQTIADYESAAAGRDRRDALTELLDAARVATTGLSEP
jgi:hypothetical protein